MTELMISTQVEIGPGDGSEGFESLYLSTRTKEGRVYSDDEVRSLPELTVSHPQHNEWLLRKESSQKLVNYLSKKNRSLQILEVGCGNGWLSNQLSQISKSEVTGMDINSHELGQANGVFGKKSNLHFMNGNTAIGIPESSYDIIVFAAAIQYFPHFSQIMRKMLSGLMPGGEIHILDSPFYQPSEIAAARQRSADHYASLDYPAMSYHYFHHNIRELDAFHHKIMFQPSMFQRMFSKNNNPFPWIIILGERK